MKDAEHQLRLAGVFVLGTLLFLAFRSFFVPSSFGQYGHYRGDAIADVAALAVVHAGHEACESCHVDIHDEKAKGRHTGINCEACHGAQGMHASDPGSAVPPRPDAAVLCAQCHEASAAKPKWFKQVNTQEHFTGMVCTGCHPAHNPLSEGAEKK
jgi:Cytochrome c554 and c-prime